MGDPAMINQKQFILLSFGNRGGYALGDIEGKGIILGENPAGQFFVKGFNSN